MNPRILISAVVRWYLERTAEAFQKRESLCGLWMSNANRSTVEARYYRRVWPYHVLKKPFYHLPFPDLEERTRFTFLKAYDLWVSRQTIPPECNVVMGPMGSCTPLFELADQARVPILKVVDAPNSHPAEYSRRWNSECDEFCPGYRIPFPDWAARRYAAELEEAGLVLCPSIFVRDSMVAHGIAPEKCVIRHFGVDTRTFTPRETLPENPVFVCVGSICLRKGHQYLYRAFARLRKEYPTARLLCIGGIRPDFRQEWPKWKGMIEHHPFLPHSEIAKVLRGATAFVLPSVEEGFARVLSEAMACGIPLVATHETGVSTVTENGEVALIPEARSVESLFSAMKQLVDDRKLNTEMGVRALAIGRVQNTWQDYGDAVLHAISRRLDDGPPAVS